MSRTRGASNARIQSEDGELIDKEGKPVSGGVMVMEEERPPEPLPGPTRYICNGATLRRDLDAWTLAKLLEIAMGGAALEVSISPDDFRQLHPDVRQHFRPVVA